MMYPFFAKVRYEEIRRIFQNRKLLTIYPVQNWFVGSVVMFILVILCFRHYPEYMIVGLVRCIVMVLVRNDFAEGDRELAVGLVAFDAVFQVFFYTAHLCFIVFFLGKLGLVNGLNISISMSDAAKTVFIYLGIPFLCDLITRVSFMKLKGGSDRKALLFPKSVL